MDNIHSGQSIPPCLGNNTIRKLAVWTISLHVYICIGGQAVVYIIVEGVGYQAERPVVWDGGRAIERGQ